MDLKIIRGITIDSVQTDDVDDGFRIKKQRGKYVVQVCIANVASVTDEKVFEIARKKVQSLYLKKGRVSMLPKAIEAKVSLLPGEPKPVICYEMTLDEQTLEVIDFKVFECLFINTNKLSYEQVAETLKKGLAISEWQKQVHLAYALAEKLYEKRRAAGALVIYDLIKGIITDENGALVIVPKPIANAYILVQELMILTNSQDAEFCFKNNIPIPFRNHELRNSGIKRETIVSDYIQMFSSGLARNRIGLMFERAVYDAESKSHYGLNIAFYTHKTSPIRRLADLIGQINLRNFLRGEPVTFSFGQVEELCLHINEQIQKKKVDMAEHEKKNARKKIIEMAQTQSLEQLSVTDFGKVLKELGRVGRALEEYVIVEIGRRIQNELLLPRDFSIIIFNNVFHVENIIEASLFFLEKKKEDFKTMIMFYCDSNVGSPVPQTVFKTSGEQKFTAKVSWNYKSVEYVSDTMKDTCSSKKEAEQFAFLSLFSKIFETQIFVVDKFPFVLRRQEKTVIEEALEKFFQFEPAEDFNFIGYLMETAQKNRFKLPVFSFVTSLNEGSECAIVFHFKKTSHSMSAKGVNKSAAKKAAAKAMFFKMKELGF